MSETICVVHGASTNSLIRSTSAGSTWMSFPPVTEKRGTVIRWSDGAGSWTRYSRNHLTFSLTSWILAVSPSVALITTIVLPGETPKPET